RSVRRPRQRGAARPLPRLDRPLDLAGLRVPDFDAVVVHPQSQFLSVGGIAQAGDLRKALAVHNLPGADVVGQQLPAHLDHTRTPVRGESQGADIPRKWDGVERLTAAKVPEFKLRYGLAISDTLGADEALRAIGRPTPAIRPRLWVFAEFSKLP